jgi:hypothetical protein
MEEIFCLPQCLLVGFYDNGFYRWLRSCIVYLELGIQERPVGRNRAHLMATVGFWPLRKSLFLRHFYSLVQWTDGTFCRTSFGYRLRNTLANGPFL